MSLEIIAPMAASDVLEVIQAIILGTSPVIPPLECIRRENVAFY